jgi:hypothetical protein
MHRKQIDGLDLHLVSIAAISGNIWTIRWSAGNARESFDSDRKFDLFALFNAAFYRIAPRQHYADNTSRLVGGACAEWLRQSNLYG